MVLQSCLKHMLVKIKFQQSQFEIFLIFIFDIWQWLWNIISVKDLLPIRQHWPWSLLWHKLMILKNKNLVLIIFLTFWCTPSTYVRWYNICARLDGTMQSGSEKFPALIYSLLIRVWSTSWKQGKLHRAHHLSLSRASAALFALQQKPGFALRALMKPKRRVFLCILFTFRAAYLISSLIKDVICLSKRWKWSLRKVIVHQHLPRSADVWT